MMSDRQHLKDLVWLEVAHTIARLATCHRLHVGCVLLRADGSVAGTGYNGSLPGAPHCDPGLCAPGGPRCLHTRHAERSALDYSQGPVATAYVTDEPCLRCCMDLAARGVRRVVFARRYAPPPEEAAARERVILQHEIVWDDGLVSPAP